MRYLLALLAAVILTACVTADASESRTLRARAAGDSLYLEIEYVGFTAAEQNGAVDSAKFFSWLASDSAATVQEKVKPYVGTGVGTAHLHRFKWPLTAAPASTTVHYGIAYGRRGAWSAPQLKSVAFARASGAAPLPPTAAKVRIRSGPVVF